MSVTPSTDLAATVAELFTEAREITARPKLTLFYLDLSQPQLYTFYGRGLVTGDERVRNTVYDNAAAREQGRTQIGRASRWSSSSNGSRREASATF